MTYTEAYAKLRELGYSEKTAMRLLHEAYLFGSHKTPFVRVAVTHTSGARFEVKAP